MESVSASFDATPDDYIALYRHVVHGSPAIHRAARRALVVYVISCLVIGCAVAISVYSSTLLPALRAQRIGLALALFAVGGAWLGWRGYSPSAARRRLERHIRDGIRTGTFKVTLGSFRMTADSDSLTVETNGSISSNAWSRVTSVQNTDEALYLDLIDGDCVRVPSRAFSSPEDRRAFLAIVETGRDHH